MRTDAMKEPDVLGEPGSFRDRDSRVFYHAGTVYRGLSKEALADWKRLQKTSLFKRFTDAHKLVLTSEVEPAALAHDLRALERDGWAGFLRHETIPFISYPYEWSFGMLKDAALLELELTGAALAEDMILKDATPYNVQWEGSRPVFIDVGSFMRMKPGEPWAGYRQFCELFLYPLFLQAYKNVRFQPWLRGSLEGIPSSEMRALMSWRDLLRPGVFLHVSVQDAVQTRYAQTKTNVKRELSASGFKKELIEINVKKLARLVGGLEWKVQRSQWSEYAGDNSYDAENKQRKADFVRRAVLERRRKLVWDLGANTGDYSRIAAEGADCVVAMDSDALAVERMYQALKSEHATSVLPLCINLADSSPSLGWRGTERKDLVARGRPELVLCLALIHHMVIGANVPMESFVGWLADLRADLVIEFVTKQDPMVQTLLRNKEDKYTDYDQAVFERLIERHFELVRKEPLAGALRVLYYAKCGGG